MLLNRSSDYFQSHFGLILSMVKNAGSFFTLSIFQSHFGLILSYFPVSVQTCITALSIPFWSDFIQRLIFYGKLLRELLSIPFWSDFIKQPPLLIDNPATPFQSHFGLILSLVPVPYMQCSDCFQSHFGLILSNRTGEPDELQNHPFNPILVWFYLLVSKFLHFRYECLSIPFWSDFIEHEFTWPNRRVLLFQSHFGLILSWHGITYNIATLLFQSHFGLILSLFLYVTVRCFYFTFNPILVWFYLSVKVK